MIEKAPMNLPTQDPNRRNLEFSGNYYTSSHSAFPMNLNSMGASSQLRQLQDDQGLLNEDQITNGTMVLSVKECTCPFMEHSSAFCLAQKDACGLTRDGDIRCFKQSTRLVLIRNAWPIVILWYAALVLFLFFTEQGRSARQYCCIRCCSRQLNEALVESILHPSRQGSIRRRRGRAIQEVDDPAVMLAMANAEIMVEENRRPQQLWLKTTRYHASSVLQGIDDEPPTCTICFGALQEGDRVGALPCKHVFHVDCLKSWLGRRNVCPLCQTRNVAEPHYSRGTIMEEQEQRPHNANYPNNGPFMSVSQDVPAENDENRQWGGRLVGLVMFRRNR
jgi:hypothetical protein